MAGLTALAAVCCIGAAAPSQDALQLVVWGEGRGAQADRALERWYRARERAELPPLQPASGFPRIVAGPGDAELVVIGVCPAALASARARLLQRRFPEVHTTPAPPELARTRDACPTLPRLAAANFDALLDEVDPKAALAAPAARGQVAVCSHDRRELRRSWGHDALCRSLWGIRCDTYDDAIAFVDPKRAADCAFLLGKAATRLAGLTGESLELLLCIPEADDVAYVFGAPPGAPLRPIDAVCGQGPDFSTTLGQARTLGAAICLDYERRSRAGGGERRELGLRCWGPDGAADELPIATAEQPHGRFAILDEAEPALLCVDPGTAPPYALRFGSEGFLPAAPLPAACTGAELEPPRVP